MIFDARQRSSLNTHLPPRSKAVKAVFTHLCFARQTLSFDTPFAHCQMWVKCIIKFVCDSSQRFAKDVAEDACDAGQRFCQRRHSRCAWFLVVPRSRCLLGLLARGSHLRFDSQIPFRVIFGFRLFCRSVRL